VSAARAGALAGRSVVVTGAGRGIGRAIAMALAAEGAHVLAAARTVGELTEVVQGIQQLGGTAHAVRCDVSVAAEVAELCRVAVTQHGPVDVLVNNAGVVVRVELAELSEDAWDRTLDTNLKGAFLCARAVLGGPNGMIARRSGRIINVGSISSTLGTPRLTAYCASKWGLLGLTKALAEELREVGVSVTAVLPGSVNTGMLVGSGFEPNMEPEDVARVVLYLATGAPHAMTGAGVEVFG
jgi:NAD(P)-dependent dehydrogenase (short-subunit alcohol dehydrogenase family)